MVAKKSAVSAVKEAVPASKNVLVAAKPVRAKRKPSTFHYRYEAIDNVAPISDLSSGYASMKDLMDDVSLSPPSGDEEIVIFRVVKRGKILTKTKVTMK